MQAASWSGPDAWPRLAAAVAAHRAALLADAPGRVLDLDLGRTVGSPSAATSSGPPYDAVLSVLQLARLDDPGAELVRVRRLLRPDGRLLVLEPNRRPGWRGVLTDLAAPFVRLACGLRVDLPIPALVRAAGFTIIAVERMTMPTPVVPLRSFVRLVAVPADRGTAAVAQADALAEAGQVADADAVADAGQVADADAVAGAGR